jgi:L,D-transpeptidase catalytic domain
MSLRTRRNAALTLLYWMILIITTWSLAGAGAPLKHPDGFETPEETIYHAIEFNRAPPSYEVFYRALNGYAKLKKANLISPKEILTIIDFKRSANEKRLWVIDLKNKKVLFHTLAAHGRNSGDEHAQFFSNTRNSNQSSLGFYVTGITYTGKHGTSLKLHGVEPGINDNAEARAIVMHGAEYVSESHIKKYGRLGRSFGCPAVPVELHEQLITALANKTCLFIYYPDPVYVAQTAFKNEG